MIVSGGMSGMADVEACARAAAGGRGIAGAIVGKALYEGRIDLAEAVRRTRGGE